jgi:hypothetical protein
MENLVDEIAEKQNVLLDLDGVDRKAFVDAYSRGVASIQADLDRTLVSMSDSGVEGLLLRVLALLGVSGSGAITGVAPSGASGPQIKALAEEGRASGRVFISYRRDDSGGYAGRLYDTLSRQFGHGRVVVDVHSIRPGENFQAVIGRQIVQCDVMLVVIGPHWLSAVDPKGRRRIDNPPP